MSKRKSKEETIDKEVWKKDIDDGIRLMLNSILDYISAATKEPSSIPKYYDAIIKCLDSAAQLADLYNSVVPLSDEWEFFKDGPTYYARPKKKVKINADSYIT